MKPHPSCQQKIIIVAEHLIDGPDPIGSRTVACKISRRDDRSTLARFRGRQSLAKLRPSYRDVIVDMPAPSSENVVQVADQ